MLVWVVVERTAQPIPRKRPFGPSFLRMTPTPWKTPLYCRTASFLDWSSPCSCSLGGGQRGAGRALRTFAHRILTVSNPWVTVTAPHAATPPATKDLGTSRPSACVLDMAQETILPQRCRHGGSLCDKLFRLLPEDAPQQNTAQQSTRVEMQQRKKNEKKEEAVGSAGRRRV